MSLDGGSALLVSFKSKIEDAVSFVPKMIAEEKLKAVQFWNLVSEKLQEIVNSSAADINALALKMEKENADKQMSLLLTPPEANDSPKDYILSDQGMMDQVPQNNTFDTNRTLEQATPNTCLPFLSQSDIDPISQTPHILNDSSAQFSNSISCALELNPSLGVIPNTPVPIASFTPIPDEDIDIPNLTPSSSAEINENKIIVEEKDTITKTSYSRKIQKKKLARTKITPKNEKDDKTKKEKEELSEDGNTEKLENNLSDEENKIPKPEECDSETFTIEKDLPFKCESCEQSFESDTDLKEHDLTTHTRPFLCGECNQRFTTKANLQVHQRRHTGEKPFQCHICGQSFSTNGNRKRHVKSHTGEKPWQCNQCGQCFTEKKSLTVHTRRHTGEKPYECKVCGKRFAQSGILQTHMALHLNLKVHLCEHCGKSFRQRSQLTLHMLRHEGVKKYICSHCSAKFLTKGDLERHNRIHTGERPFACNLCKKAFTRQQCLNEHMNRHYGVKPYECKYCRRKFSEMSACYKHTKTHEKSGKLNVGANGGNHISLLTPVDQSDLIGFLVGSENEIHLPKDDMACDTNMDSNQSSVSENDSDALDDDINIKIVNIVGSLND